MNVQLNCITQPKPVRHDRFSGTIFEEEAMTPEEYMIYAARISSDERINNDTAPRLLKFLIDHKHWSPFEMISIGIEIQTSRAIAQQMLRHRSFSFQEFSQRYAAVTDMEPVQLRYQAEKNRQSSTTKVDNEFMIDKVNKHIEATEQLYNELINNHVAKECARMVLPLTTQTTIIMHGTLRSWIHFFEQRCSPHAQLEIQQIAYAARNAIGMECPWTANALGWEIAAQAN